MLVEARSALTNPQFDWSTRLVRLAGWRGGEVRAASESGWRLRIAPAFCGVAAIALGLIGQPLWLGLLAATAAVGAVRGNHVVEQIYNATLGRRGVSIPKARAARASGCAISAVILAASAIAFAIGLPTLGLILAVSLGGLAVFVAVTKICVPSLMFVALFGELRSTAPSLRAALSSCPPETPSDRRRIEPLTHS